MANKCVKVMFTTPVGRADCFASLCRGKCGCAIVARENMNRMAKALGIASDWLGSGCGSAVVTWGGRRMFLSTVFRPGSNSVALQRNGAHPFDRCDDCKE